MSTRLVLAQLKTAASAPTAPAPAAVAPAAGGGSRAKRKARGPAAGVAAGRRAISKAVAAQAADASARRREKNVRVLSARATSARVAPLLAKLGLAAKK